MLARSAVPALLALCLGLSACASSGGGGGDDRVSVSADGLLTRGGATRSDMGFIYAEKGCLPFALDGAKNLDLLGDPQRVVNTNDYIGTAIYAVPAGPHQVTARSSIDVDGLSHEALPVTSLTVVPRHFYGLDCTHGAGVVDISITERDHLGSRND